MPNNLLPFPLPAPDSLRAIDAAQWYYATVPLIAGLLEDAPVRSSKLDFAWSLASRLRLAAALALWDQDLVGRFFATFELPSMAQLSGIDHYDVLRYDEGCGELPDHVPDDEAVVNLLALVATQREAFDHTLGDGRGMAFSDAQDRRWTMTADGWVAKA